MSWKKKPKIPLLRSISFRIAIMFTVALVLIASGVSAFLYAKLKSELNEEADLFLRTEITELEQILLEDGTDLKKIGSAMDEDIYSDRVHFKTYMALLSEKGEPLVTSSNFPSLRWQDIKTTCLKHKAEDISWFTTAGEESGKIRSIATRLNEGRSIGLVAIAMNRIETTLAHYRRRIFYIFPALFLIAMCGGLILSRLSLRPIMRMAKAARKISASKLERRLPVRGVDDELDFLAQTINRMLEKIEASFELVTRFTADASHEIRTPIARIQAEIELALFRCRSPKEYTEALANLSWEAERLSILVSSLLELSRIDAGKLPLETEAVLLPEILDDVVCTYEVPASMKNIALRSGMRENIWIKCDKVKIKQLFLNLLDNAVKFTPEGGHVNVVCRADGENALVNIEDTGPGIQPKDKDRIFDRFYRGQSIFNQNAEGFGLGLSLARAIARIHDGEIKVSNRPAGGTIFTVLLPLLTRPT
jgi:heavy metal sensor kinase